MVGAPGSGAVTAPRSSPRSARSGPGQLGGARRRAPGAARARAAPRRAGRRRSGRAGRAGVWSASSRSRSRSAASGLAARRGGSRGSGGTTRCAGRAGPARPSGSTCDVQTAGSTGAASTSSADAQTTSAITSASRSSSAWPSMSRTAADASRTRRAPPGHPPGHQRAGRSPGDRPERAGWRGSRPARRAPRAGARRSSGGRRSGPRGRGRRAGPPRLGRHRRGRAPRARTPRWSARAGARCRPATACCSKRCQHSTIALRGSPSMASRARCSSASSAIAAVTCAADAEHLELDVLGSTSPSPRRRARHSCRSLRSRRPKRNSSTPTVRISTAKAMPASQPGGSPRFCSRASASGSLGGRGVVAGRRLVRTDPLDVAAGDHPVGADRGRPRDQDEQQPSGAEHGDDGRRTGTSGRGHSGNVTAGTD